jgi:tetratricopeptide (TPR) repeat protein
MHTLSAPDGNPVLAPAFLDQIEADIDAGLFLRAHPHIEALVDRGGPRGMLLAARALHHLGAERQSDALTLRAARRYRQDPEVATAFIRQRLGRHGPYHAWRLCEANRLHDSCPADLRAEFLSLHAYVYCLLRDVDSCERLRSEALALAPDLPWLWVEWSYCCERMDRYDDAMAAVDQALRIHPAYRSALQQKGQLMVLAGQTAEAMNFFATAFANSESWGLGYQLFELQYDGQDYAAARHSLARIETLLPRPNKWMCSWLAARRCDLAMGEGNLAEARAEAAQVIGPGFYENILQRIDDGATSQRRVVLPVGFVRQHWKTCAPATLSALCHYFGLPANHLDIAEEICYDGTTDYSERRWASKNGLYAREFRLDWLSAQALLDAGIPFALATVSAGSGHLQAVIGYDLLRGSLLIRDPFQPTHAEFDAMALFESHQASGPRAMVIVPLAERARLDGIDLPEADLWDHYHALTAALARHARDDALQALDLLRGLDATHRLSLLGARAIAMYDGDENAILAATETLLARYPDDLNLQLSKASSLSVIGGRPQHLEYLAELARAACPPPQALVRYAALLAEDGRNQADACAIVQRALRLAALNPAAWSGLGDLAWQAGDKEDCLALYRIAACLDETNENLASEYMRQCHILGRGETGLTFLRNRLARLGARSAAPALTLFEHLDSLEHAGEGFAVLEAALAVHPDDAHLRVQFVEALIRHGRLAEAERLLGPSDQGFRRASWLRARAMLAEVQGDVSAALVTSREACVLQPLNLAHHRMVARLLASTESQTVALDHIRAACERHPQHYGLNRLLYDWLPRGSAEEEAQLRHLVGLYPNDLWSLRELAIRLADQQRWDEAEHFARASLSRAPLLAASHGTLALVQIRRSGYAAAEAALREAVRLDVDYRYALATLIEDAPDKTCADEAIAFVRAELIRQVTIGDALLGFQESARVWLSPEALLPPLHEAFEARPDLWQTWVSYGSQLTRSGQAEAALALFAEAVEKFPALPRLFVEYAQALKSLGRRDEARAQAARALEISPGWNRAVRLYVDTCTESGTHWEEAIAALKRALVREPSDADLRGLLGWVFEQRADYKQAWQEVAQSLRADPSPAWVWETGRRVLDQLGRADALLQLLDEIEQRRAGDPWTWIARARLLPDPAAALHAAERATELAPRLVEAWTARFELLLQQARHAEVPPLLAALDWPQGVPPSLRLFASQARRAGGDKAGAVTELRALIAEMPNHYSLHRQLADWADTDEDHAAYLAASEELIRLAPNYAAAQGYLGHALVKLGRSEDAIAPFQRAFEIDGEYFFAGKHLLDACLQHGRLAQALATAEALWARYPRADVAAEACHAAAQLDSRNEAESWLTRTLSSARYDTDSTRRAYDAVLKVGWEKMAHACVKQCIRAGACASHAVSRWLSYLHETRSDKQLLRDLEALLREESGIALKMGLLDHAAQQDDHRLLDLVLRAHAPRLRQNDETWGQVSYALQCHDKHAATRHWLRDWRHRPEAPGWALGNASLAHASLNQFATAGEIARHVLSREPANPDARLWHCVELALSRQFEALAEQLAQLDDWEPDAWMREPIRLLKVYLAASQGQTGETLAAFRALRAACGHMPSMRHLHRRLRYPVLRYFKWWQWPHALFALHQ